MEKLEKPNPANGRYNTNEETKRIVWIQSAGHCELCGNDLTHDYRVGKPMKWGEVAHVLPASPKGPRGRKDHDEAKAQASLELLREINSKANSDLPKPESPEISTPTPSTSISTPWREQRSANKRLK